MVSDGVAEDEVGRPGEGPEQDHCPQLRHSGAFAKLRLERLAHRTLGAKSITAKTTTCQKMMKYQYSAFSKTSLKRFPSWPLSVNTSTINPTVSSQSVNKCAVWKPSKIKTAELYAFQSHL